MSPEWTRRKVLFRLAGFFVTSAACTSGIDLGVKPSPIPDKTPAASEILEKATQPVTKLEAIELILGLPESPTKIFALTAVELLKDSHPDKITIGPGVDVPYFGATINYEQSPSVMRGTYSMLRVGPIPDVVITADHDDSVIVPVPFIQEPPLYLRLNIRQGDQFTSGMRPFITITLPKKELVAKGKEELLLRIRKSLILKEALGLPTSIQIMKEMIKLMAFKGLPAHYSLNNGRRVELISFGCKTAINNQGKTLKVFDTVGAILMIKALMGESGYKELFYAKPEDHPGVALIERTDLGSNPDELVMKSARLIVDNPQIFDNFFGTSGDLSKIY